jgi:hypothetical protein
VHVIAPRVHLAGTPCTVITPRARPITAPWAVSPAWLGQQDKIMGHNAAQHWFFNFHLLFEKFEYTLKKSIENIIKPRKI